VELGRIDVAYVTYEVQLLASYSGAPRKGGSIPHRSLPIPKVEAFLTGVFRCLEKHIKFNLVLDHRIRDSMEQIDFKDFVWERYYDLIPYNAPYSFDNPLQMVFYADSAFATDLVTRQSTTTGIIRLVRGAPTQRYSKRQVTVEIIHG
jgi:hypothetical protein